ncbi:MAG: hypothetical protein ABSH48_15460 [Verrucomicrobiota bacterium]|jgi:hypothetical protein
MPQKNEEYWAFFDIVGKLVGLAFAVGFGILAVWSFVTDALDITGSIVLGGLSAVMSVLGVLMIKAKPTNPTDPEEKK